MTVRSRSHLLSLLNLGVVICAKSLSSLRTYGISESDEFISLMRSVNVPASTAKPCETVHKNSVYFGVVLNKKMKKNTGSVLDQFQTVARV